MFIVPMDAEGVTVRGLRQITGDAEFNEVFFDDVKLDEDAVVGGVNNGWGTALTTLMFERLTIGFGCEGMGYRPERFAGRIAADPAAARNGEVRQRLGHVATELMAVRFTGYRMLSALQQGQIPGPEAGLSKITTVNAGIQACELVADVVGPDALREDVENPFSYHTSFLPGPEVRGRDRGDPAQHDRRARARPAPRATARQGHPVQRAARQGEGGGGVMNLELSDEQVFLRDAARQALSRTNTIEAARESRPQGYDGGKERPDLWPAAVEAGWTGLLVCEERGGAGLGAFDAMLVLMEAGRRLAPVPADRPPPRQRAARRGRRRGGRARSRRRRARGVRRRAAARRPRRRLDRRGARAHGARGAADHRRRRVGRRPRAVGHRRAGRRRVRGRRRATAAPRSSRPATASRSRRRSATTRRAASAT